MKASVILSALTLSLLISAEALAQRTSGARAQSARESVAREMERVREQVLGQGRTSSAGLQLQARDQATNRVVEMMQIEASLKQGVRDSFRIDARNDQATVEGRIDRAITIVATYEAARQMRADAQLRPEAESMTRAADAAIRALIDAPLIGARPRSRLLEAEEMTLVIEGLKKEADITDAIMRMDRTERDSWTQIMERRAQLVREGKGIEDAYVEAIMAVKGVDKRAALDLVRKVKECV